jgi:uncharacterized protein
MQFEAASGIGHTLQSYGADGFKVDGQMHATHLLLSPTLLQSFSGELTAEALEPLLTHQPRIEFLIIGMGASLKPTPPALRNALRQRGISVDSMDTGAACRTYSVMQSEGRRVGAVLLLS